VSIPLELVDMAPEPAPSPVPDFQLPPINLLPPAGNPDYVFDDGNRLTNDPNDPIWGPFQQELDRQMEEESRRPVSPSGEVPDIVQDAVLIAAGGLAVTAVALAAPEIALAALQNPTPFIEGGVAILGGEAYMNSVGGAGGVVDDISGLADDAGRMADDVAPLYYRVADATDPMDIQRAIDRIERIVGPNGDWEVIEVGDDLMSLIDARAPVPQFTVPDDFVPGTPGVVIDGVFYPRD
jgi:hypothetical protein